MKYYLMLLLLASLGINAKSLSSADEMQILTNSVMKSVAANQMKGGLEKLRPYIVFPMSEFDVQLNNIDMQLPMISQRFGKSIGYDLIAEEKLGDSLVQYAYLQKFERHVLVWRFIFYKPEKEWLLNTFYFNDQVQPLFRY